MPKISSYIVLFALGSLVIGCTQADRPDAGGRTQVAEQQANDPNAVNEAGDPIIFEAIDRMDLARVQRLVEAGADIEKQGFGYQTPALRAASANQWDICLYLLNQGADPTVADHSGLTIPYIAFNIKTVWPMSNQEQHWAAIKEYLIKRNLDVLNILPKRVRELQAAGAWPPRGMSAG